MNNCVGVNKESLFDLNLRFSDLMNDTGQWLEQKVNDIFPPDARPILAMSLSPDKDDFWIWPYLKPGTYSMKSGCVFLQKE